MRLSPYDEVEKALYAWFIDIRTTQTIPLSGPIIRAKAPELANKMGITDFTASTGWFDRFKHRFNIVFKTACGESVAAPTEVVDACGAAKSSTVETDVSPIDDSQFRNVWDYSSRHFGVADDDAPTSAPLTDDELIAAARPATMVPETDEEEQEEAEPADQQQPDRSIKSTAEAYDLLSGLRAFLTSRAQLPAETARCIDHLQDFVLTTNLARTTQTSIKDFFKSSYLWISWSCWMF